VQTTDMQTIQEKATQSFQKAKQMATTTAEKGKHFGEKFASSSVDALETVGKSALELLTVQEKSPGTENSRLRPIFFEAPNRPNTKVEGESFEDVINRNWFEESSGTAYLQALENLSIECTMRMQKIEQKLDPKHREELHALFQKVKEIFGDEEEATANHENLPQIELNEKAAMYKEIMDALAIEGKARSLEMIALYKADIQDLLPDASNASIITATDIGHLTASYLDKVLLECVKYLSKYSALSVEQLLRIVENYVASDLQKLEVDNDLSLKKATFVFMVSQIFINELSQVSNSFVESIRVLSEEGKEQFATFAKRSEQDLSESNKCREDIESKTNLHMNHIYLHTSNAIANIQESTHFIFPICKSLLVPSMPSILPTSREGS